MSRPLPPDAREAARERRARRRAAQAREVLDDRRLAPARRRRQLVDRFAVAGADPEQLRIAFRYTADEDPPT